MAAANANLEESAPAMPSVALPVVVASSKQSGSTNKHIPHDKICLRLILVSGKTAEFVVPPEWSAQQIAQHVFQQWPEHWDSERVGQPSLLKLIYHGRFLHHAVTLQALSLPTGKVTVMHLVARENLPEPNSHDNPHKRKACCQCCSLM